MSNKLVTIFKELKSHAPFTLFGASTGIICMFLFRNLNHEVSRTLFYIFHPAHVLLSAIVTAAIYNLYSRRKHFIFVLLIGFFGSIGIGTLSDSLIPYIGETMLGMHVETHAHEHVGFAEEAHIGFIEGWYIVIPAAIIGVLIGHFWPKTKFPHAGHVLLSTWASSFHMIMAMAGQLTALKVLGSFGFLFLAVWLPCCISDIVFPLIFVRSNVVLIHHH